jgi:hypothetical protein
MNNMCLNEDCEFYDDCSPFEKLFEYCRLDDDEYDFSDFLDEQWDEFSYNRYVENYWNSED